jgi:hypothetical protein
MSERIRSLLQRVASGGPASNPLDGELRERLPNSGSIAALERDIASEIAHSLGRAGSKLEAAIQQAAASRAALAASVPGSAERRALRDRFDVDRTAAERRLRDLLIQREAIGLRNHADVHRRFVIPERWPSDPEVPA